MAGLKYSTLLESLLGVNSSHQAVMWIGVMSLCTVEALIERFIMKPINQLYILSQHVSVPLSPAGGWTFEK